MHRARHLTCHPKLLDAEAILSAISPRERAWLAHLDILAEVDSTNLYLMRKAIQGAASGSVCLAEQQHAGRGRHGRSWVSPAGCNIYLSLLWRFPPGTVRTAGLSIAMGVAVAHALTAMDVADVQLKWPNDLLWQGRKLAGILIDTATQTSGAHYAVIGVGLNVAMPAQQGAGIDQPWVDIQGILGQPVKRNRCAGLLVQHLLSALQEFQSCGLAASQQEWAKLDALAGKQVNLRAHNDIITGIAQGIDTDGSFKLLLANGEMRRYQSAEVSVKIADRQMQNYAAAGILE